VEMALIDQAPRTATAVAKSPCKLAVITEKRFAFLVQTTPYFALHVMKVMAERLRRMDGLLVSNRGETTRSAATP